MFLLLAFGTVMLGFGCYMCAQPIRFSNGIIWFSERKWFHLFEIVSRFILGVFFILFSDKTAYPLFVNFLGGLLCFVSLFLVAIGSNRHRRFALLVAKIGKNFRYLGLIAIICGAIIVSLGLMSK